MTKANQTPPIRTAEPVRELTAQDLEINGLTPAALYSDETAPVILATVEHASATAAFVAFQREVPDIERNRRAEVRSQGKLRFAFDYTSLDYALRVLRPLLARHGLAYSQVFEGRQLRTVLLWSDTPFLESVLDLELILKPPVAREDFGAAVTYCRRYSLMALLGLASEQNDDIGTAAQARREQLLVTEPEQRIRQADVERALGLAAEGGWSADEVEAALVAYFDKSKLDTLTATEGRRLIQLMEAQLHPSLSPHSA